jgi:hypothetical protein
LGNPRITHYTIQGGKNSNISSEFYKEFMEYITTRETPPLQELGGNIMCIKQKKRRGRGKGTAIDFADARARCDVKPFGR